MIEKTVRHASNFDVIVGIGMMGVEGEEVPILIVSPEDTKDLQEMMDSEAMVYSHLSLPVVSGKLRLGDVIHVEVAPAGLTHRVRIFCKTTVGQIGAGALNKVGSLEFEHLSDQVEVPRDHIISWQRRVEDLGGALYALVPKEDPSDIKDDHLIWIPQTNITVQ